VAKLKNKWMESPGGIDLREGVPTGTINGANKSFALPSAPNEVISLTLNSRILKSPTDYTINGQSLILTEAPAFGQELYIIYY
jgi:hypothetical protein